MFDRIKCEVPLPDGWVPDELQTKDFDCEMIEHRISAGGRLLLDNGHNEMVPIFDRPLWKREWGDSEDARKEHALEAACGCMRRVPKYEDSNFHGVVNFYGNETTGYEPDERYGTRGRPLYKHHDYNAKFTDGNLVEIVLTEDVE